MLLILNAKDVSLVSWHMRHKVIRYLEKMAARETKWKEEKENSSEIINEGREVVATMKAGLVIPV